MCGLVGMMGDINAREKKMFRDMLVFDAVRGFDSTGIVTIQSEHIANTKNTPPIYMTKDLGAPQNLWDDNGDQFFNDRGITKLNPRCIIGHNRAATIGKVTVSNAHPFRYKHIVGAHNGSLKDWFDLHNSKDFDVDSKALFNHIAEKGIKDAWKSFIGAAALTFWDNKEQRLNIIRNNERPLYIVRAKDNKTLFWASELWMITVAAMRNAVPLEENEKGQVLFVNPEPNFLYKYSCTTMDYKYESKEELEVMPPPTYHSGVNYGANYTASSYKPYIPGNVTPKFTPFPDWKEGTERSNLKIKQIVLGRPVVCFRNKISYFSFTVYKGGIAVGSVHIHPQNKKEHDELCTIYKQAQASTNIVFTLRHRPRIVTSSASKHLTDYRATGPAITWKQKSFALDKKKSEGEVIKFPSKDEIEGQKEEPLKLYKSRDGHKISYETAVKELEEAGGSCAYCANTLMASDSLLSYWVDKTTCVCPECVDNFGGDMNLMFGN